jgi:hypothetical protein
MVRPAHYLREFRENTLAIGRVHCLKPPRLELDKDSPPHANNPYGLSLKGFLFWVSTLARKPRFLKDSASESWLESTAYIQCPACGQVIKTFSIVLVAAHTGAP